MKRSFSSMKWRLMRRAVFIRTTIGFGLIILALTAWWQLQVHRAIAAADVGTVSADQCEDLDETNELVLDGDPNVQGVNEAELQERLHACEDQGYETSSADAEQD